MMGRAARWVKRYSRTDKPHRPPPWAAEHILECSDWPLPYLQGVIESPTIRADGSILDKPGWDQATELLYEPVPRSNGWPAIPDTPSRGDVDAAVERLTEPIEDFPFVADSDRSAAIATILTLLARHLIHGPAPMVAIRAPTPGTGKTLLANVLGLIGTGRALPAMAHTYDSEELRKRITALAQQGSQAILLDNVSGSLGSDVLAIALTATEWQDRKLGTQDTITVPLRVVWITTGNNIGFKRTLSRRVIPIDLDARCETPEDRTGWLHDDLMEFVAEQRPQLVTDALTILRAFILAGRPHHGGPRMGSFESWDDLIRSCIVWTGLADPASTDPEKGRGRIRSQADDDTETVSRLLAELAEEWPLEARFCAGDVLERSKNRTDLHSALDAAVSSKSGITARTIGASLRSMRDRLCDGHSLRWAGKGREGVTWYVQVSGNKGDR
jgi:hypothetical protein